MPAHGPEGQRYAFGPSVRLAVAGSARVRVHFEREYGPGVVAGSAQVEADVRLRRGPAGRHAKGGHKTARWRVALGPPEEHPLRVAIGIGGGPPSFALSLVQGYYIEPLVAVALARAGFVALPSAGILDGGGALVIMGRSGSGKSSVSMRALAAGRGILGDDQVIVAGDGGCWPYPRRLRLYPDIRDTAPEAWRRLHRSTRRALRLRRAVRRATAGFVAPSLAVPVSELGTPAPVERVPASRLVVVERSADVQVLTEDEHDAGWAALQAAEVRAAQRTRFAAGAGERWQEAVRQVAAQEAEILRAWLAPLPVAQLRIPRAWDAATAVRALAERLGI
jgi:hypothetical protein